MSIALMILGIYIGMVIFSLLGPYVDFRKNYCIKGERYTLEDFYNKMEDIYWVTCFFPIFNATTVIMSLVFLFIVPLWNKVKNIRIV